ncbi:septum formation inhibitor Maf [Aquimarina sp. W85]|uniref:septum formation inhibitor Maf n=1 Tax=Aquimarina rhodophyticola TaxID=3342246 RepID=UPI00366A9DD3
MRVSTLLWIGLILMSCNDGSAIKNESQLASITPQNSSLREEKPLTTKFKDYWYAGEAEITSYSLNQVRYGELRKGSAVLIYVTEDFLPDIQVKANQKKPSNISVLKLNATKKFTTGIYPYAIMQSTFYPVANNQHALKVTSSIQEWCGQVYAQLNSKEKFDIISHSYFQGEGDQAYQIEKTLLENELWTKLRIDPMSLPQGTRQIVPSFEYCRLFHKEIKAYTATTHLKQEDSLTTYTLSYPELKRSLSITFDTKFPHQIDSWTEHYSLDDSPTKLVTSAKRIKTIKSDYWSKNSTQYNGLRDTLKLN